MHRRLWRRAMPVLRELQSDFAAALFDREALAGLAPEVLARGLDPARRLQIYRNNLFASLTEVLAAVYPITRRLVGEAYFCQAARGYIAYCPSCSGDVHRYGARFPRYLGRCPGSDALPYLPDVARLEWAYHSAFHAEQHPALDLEALRIVPPEDYARLRLMLQPSVRLLASEYPVLRIWQVNQPDCADEATVDLAEGGVRLLILRQGVEIALISLGDGEYAWLHELARGMTLLESQQRAEARDPRFDLGNALRHQLVINGAIHGFALD
jgi:hypothetical protein